MTCILTPYKDNIFTNNNLTSSKSNNILPCLLMQNFIKEVFKHNLISTQNSKLSYD